jgi:hypothetical protein
MCVASLGPSTQRISNQRISLTCMPLTRTGRSASVRHVEAQCLKAMECVRYCAAYTHAAGYSAAYLAYCTSGGRWDTQLLHRSSTLPPAERICGKNSSSSSSSSSLCGGPVDLMDRVT